MMDDVDFQLCLDIDDYVGFLPCPYHLILLWLE